MIAWRLAPGMAVRPAGEEPPGAVLLTSSAGRSTVLRPAAPEVAEALLSLDAGPQPAGPAPHVRDAIDRQLAELLHRGVLELCCLDRGRQLLRASATSELAAVTRVRPGPAQRVRLSRFAVLRRADEELVVESPTAYTRLVVEAPEVAALLARLVEACGVGELCADARLPAAVVADLLELLTSAGVAGVVDGDGRLPEDADPVRAQREVHDVLLHWHSRKGLSGGQVGVFYPFRGRFSPLPAVKPVHRPLITLPRPDLARLRKVDPPFAEVAEERRSVRAFSTGPLTPEQLGEFLYRTARVREEWPADDNVPYGRTGRPVPSAGASQDLEIYLTVTRCRGLAAGVYHYEPAAHGLTLVTSEREAMLRLVRDSCENLGTASVPQVVVTLAARFNRMAWKYRGLSYAATLKNAGVLCHAMYLAATAMRLGGCAAGSGNAVAFARATGFDVLEESSVGEFALGVPLDG